MVNATAGSGKCLGYDTPVLLWSGEIVPVQKIQSGDLLIGPDSQPRLILSTTKGNGPLYRITPIKGDSFVCNEDHILTLAGTNEFRDQVIDISVRDILNNNGPGFYLSSTGRRDKNWKLWRTGINTNYYTEEDINFDPYIMGVWIGDGHTDAPVITTPDDEIFSACVEVANNYGLGLVVYNDKRSEGLKTIRFRVGNRGKAHRNTPHALRRELALFRDGDGNKSIPIQYLWNTREIRMELLAGILDTDGYLSGGYFEVVSKLEHLANQYAFLARSLGFAAYVCQKDFLFRGEPYTAWRVTISGNISEIPTRVTRRQAAGRQQIKRTNVTGWSIEYVGNGDYYGFTLSGDGRFLLGDFTVTHNTTTIVEAVKLLRGSTLFLAFNKHIAEALQKKMPEADCRTNHSLGFGALREVNSGVRLDNWKHNNIIQDYVRRGHYMYEERELVSTASRLADLARMSLTPEEPAALSNLAYYYGIDYYGPEVDLALRAIEEGRGMWEKAGIIDYADMIYLPVHYGYALPGYDNVLVDESQDVSPAQLALIQGIGAKMAFTGDRRQAINGFAGADPRATDNIVEKTNAVELPLSICYRCPKSHIRLAQEIAPEIEWRDGAPEGVIGNIPEQYVQEQVQVGDMIICRVTAPLIKLCLQLVASRVPAYVRGRDIGKGLVAIVNKVAKMRGYRWESFGSYLDKWKDDEIRRLMRKQNSQSAIDAVLDKYDSIWAILMGSDANSERDLNREIETLFKDGGEAVTLSTVHRVKGLQSDRVFILHPEKMPLRWRDQLPWQLEQEMNVKFVALTRAKQELWFIED